MINHVQSPTLHCMASQKIMAWNGRSCWIFRREVVNDSSVTGIPTAYGWPRAAAWVPNQANYAAVKQILQLGAKWGWHFANALVLWFTSPFEDDARERSWSERDLASQKWLLHFPEVTTFDPTFVLIPPCHCWCCLLMFLILILAWGYQILLEFCESLSIRAKIHFVLGMFTRLGSSAILVLLFVQSQLE